VIVSRARGFVFAHVPKTGGISVRAALAPFEDCRLRDMETHDTLAALLARHPETQALFKFAFVRNPWDRMVSFHAYARRYLARAMPVFGTLSFDAMLRALDRGEAWTRTIHAFRPQGEIASGADFTGRFERLAADFARACRHVGIAPALPCKNATEHRPYSACYNNWGRDFVAARYADDVAAFGYRFGVAG